MKKDIEDLLKDRRRELELEIPPMDAWDGIREQLRNERKVEERTLGNWWKVAAVIFFVSTIGLVVYNNSLQERMTDLASLGDISDEYKSMEQTYEKEIAELTTNLPMETVMTSEELAWLAEELETLEEINQQYRMDIGTDVDQELLVSALIDYYEKKLRLLKKLELEINRYENEKRNTDAIDIS